MRLKSFFEFYLKFNGLIVFGGHPFSSELERDGYFKRVKAIDAVLMDYQRIYIDRNELPTLGKWYRNYDPNLMVISVRYSWAARLCAFLFIVKAKILYFHSVYPLKYLGFLLYLPFKYRILDLHGVVPEEEYDSGNLFNGKIYDLIEKNTIKKADCIIVVSNAMRMHLIAKYGTIFFGKYILLPNMPVINEELIVDNFIEKKPTVIYAGGLQKWQQIIKMLQIISEMESYFQFYIFCPEPGLLYEILYKMKINLASVPIDTVTHDELPKYYRKCQYGFILREDNLINKVACPTKLVEYLAFGVIPIMDYVEIGDFLFYGLKYIHYERFLQRRLPDVQEQVKMIKNNNNIYKKLKLEYLNGAKHLQSILTILLSKRKNSN